MEQELLIEDDVQVLGDSSSSNTLDTPHVGMYFSSEEEVRAFYKSYVQGLGFGISKLGSKKGDDGQIKYFHSDALKMGSTIDRKKDELSNIEQIDKFPGWIKNCWVFQAIKILQRNYKEENNPTFPPNDILSTSTKLVWHLGIEELRQNYCGGVLLVEEFLFRGKYGVRLWRSFRACHRLRRWRSFTGGGASWCGGALGLGEASLMEELHCYPLQKLLPPLFFNNNPACCSRQEPYRRTPRIPASQQQPHPRGDVISLLLKLLIFGVSANLWSVHHPPSQKRSSGYLFAACLGFLHKKLRLFTLVTTHICSLLHHR
ncbi:hypothetical protein ZIOFF_004775 [Zingiber officinale]|uniref:Protein FAR1-RELATED SEQUENCE n=1 Tax=Zingiber officinale TaxID=94328 RepID=A0A8J5HTP6_ZINOF|nr:hypothetical protein ZIOFF_004775 [Zingiber officinale]